MENAATWAAVAVALLGIIVTVFAAIIRALIKSEARATRLEGEVHSIKMTRNDDKMECNERLTRLETGNKEEIERIHRRVSKNAEATAEVRNMVHDMELALANNKGEIVGRLDTLTQLMGRDSK